MLCTNCHQEEIYAKNECTNCYRYRIRTGKARPPGLCQKNVNPADKQRQVATRALRNTITGIKRQARLSTDQAAIIYALCQALAIEPVTVLDEAMNLIDPPKPESSPLIERLNQESKLMNEPGRMLSR